MLLERLRQSIEGQKPSRKNVFTRILIDKIEDIQYQKLSPLEKRVRAGKLMNVVMTQLGRDAHRRVEEKRKRGYYRV
jgi:hypothetical protein